MKAVPFDDQCPDLAPLTDLRSAGDVRTGALTTAERWARAARRAGVEMLGAVPCPAVAELSREGPTLPVLDVGAIPPDTLLVNGRWLLPTDAAWSLPPGRSLRDTGGTLLAARTAPAAPAAEWLRDFAANASDPSHTLVHEARVLNHPADIIRHRDACLDFDLALSHAAPLTTGHAAGATLIAPDRIRAAPSARVWPGAILDATDGAIVLDDNAVVRPGAIVVGPAYIGPGSTVLERALIKGHSAIGPVCKVNGEISGTIFQSHSNKAHDGFLGDSWVGQWVNLGAGTTNSNLLNTYGEVVMQCTPSGPRHRTGLTFMGCILGDHVKTAIGTRIMTGAVLGTGAMFAASSAAAGAIGTFAWVTDKGAQRFRFEKFEEVMRAAMARRKAEPGAAYLARLRTLYTKATA